MVEVACFWIVLAAIVGIAAGTLRRNGIGYFILAILISPLLAGLLLLALGRRPQPGLSWLESRRLRREQEKLDRLIISK